MVGIEVLNLFLVIKGVWGGWLNKFFWGFKCVFVIFILWFVLLFKFMV